MIIHILLLAAHMQIAPGTEPGQRMILTGRVVDRAGQPVSAVEIYAYHTDAEGNYRRDNSYPEQPPRLQGRLVTGADGAYVIATIKPAAYPHRDIPAHIHFRLRRGGFEQSETTWFAGDPLITTKFANEHGADIVTLRKGSDGVLRGAHDFHLR